MQSYYTVAWIAFFHWVADFAMQTDRMAQGKSRSNYWLTAHVLVYTGMMYVTAGTVIYGITRDAYLTMLWVLGNGAAHWVTDWFTSRWTSALYLRGDRHNFFVVIGLDQLAHMVTLVITLGLVTTS